jgi:hypothetical protein
VHDVPVVELGATGQKSWQQEGQQADVHRANKLARRADRVEKGAENTMCEQFTNVTFPSRDGGRLVVEKYFERPPTRMVKAIGLVCAKEPPGRSVFLFSDRNHRRLTF